jgi:hypothetical protein
VNQIRKSNRNVIINIGYRESNYKPNLFYKKDKEVVFFIDMRKMDDIYFWDETSPIPLFYAKINESIPNWKNRRIIRDEIVKLEKNGCLIKPFQKGDENSLNEYYDDIEKYGSHGHCFKCGKAYHTEEKICENIYCDECEDGVCMECGIDFQSHGYFCSDECKNKSEKKRIARIINSSPFCKVCGRKIIKEEDVSFVKELLEYDPATMVVEHHTSYKENHTINVCPSCHAKIHHSKNPAYKKYQPESKRPEMKSRYFGKCEKCGNKAKINRETNRYICYQCRTLSPCKYCGKLTSSIYQTCNECKDKFRNKRKEIPLPSGRNLK